MKVSGEEGRSEGEWGRGEKGGKRKGESEEGKAEGKEGGRVRVEGGREGRREREWEGKGGIYCTNICFVQLRDVRVQSFVHLHKVYQRIIFYIVQKIAALGTDTVLLEVPIKEHPSRNSSLSAVVAHGAVILPIKSAQLGFTKKNCVYVEGEVGMGVSEGGIT